MVRSCLGLALALAVCFLQFSLGSQSGCPLWHSRNSFGQCVCCDSLEGAVKCTNDYIEIQDGHCMTWNDKKKQLEVSLCLQTRHPNYNLCGKHGSYKIPTNISNQELNSVVCGSYNRQDLYCGKCTDDHGPALFSDSAYCADCSQRKQMWILNLLMQLGAVTLMYIVVIILQIKGTSSPLNVIITYSQIFINGLKYGSGMHRRLLCFFR